MRTWNIEGEEKQGVWKKAGELKGMEEKLEKRGQMEVRGKEAQKVAAEEVGRVNFFDWSESESEKEKVLEKKKIKSEIRMKGKDGGSDDEARVGEKTIRK